MRDLKTAIVKSPPSPHLCPLEGGGGGGGEVGETLIGAVHQRSIYYL